MTDVIVKATPNALLPFTANIQGHDAQGVPWSRSYTFTSLATSYAIDEIEVQQLADVFTRGTSGLPVQAVRISDEVTVTGGGILGAHLQGAAAARGVVTGGGNLHGGVLSGAAAGLVTAGGGLTLATIATGLTLKWSDNCSAADPLSAGKWSLAPVQTVDNTGSAIEYPATLSSPHAMSTTPSARFLRTASGGATGAGWYKFFAPAGDNIFSDGGRGRASIDYPRFDPGSSPAHIGPEGGSNGIGFAYEGRRTITAFATRLPSATWSLTSATDWRLLSQWKRNEWYNVSSPDDSPALDLEQKLYPQSGGTAKYMIRNLGITAPIWSVTAVGTADAWVRWAFDITWSQSTGTGKVRVYADFNNDGIYEYDSGTISGIQTLSSGSDVIESGLAAPIAARFPAEGIESFFSIGVYEADGGDTANFSDLAIYG